MMTQYNIDATYGTVDRFVDVTHKLIEHFKVDNKIIIPKNCNFNQYFGDPHFSRVKFLLMEINNHQYSVREDHIAQNREFSLYDIGPESPFIRMSLESYLINSGSSNLEGHIQMCHEQVQLLKKIVSTGAIKNIMEIGFNAGHSAVLFLENNSSINVTSFDIGEHDYVNVGKKYIDINYPSRHTLIIGNSIESVPIFINRNSVTFDLIFIDGGHEYNVAKVDLENCKKLSHKNTIVIMDDTTYTHGWEQGYTVGPTRVWLEGINNKLITEISRIDFSIGHGMSWGKYLFD